MLKSVRGHHKMIRRHRKVARYMKEYPTMVSRSIKSIEMSDDTYSDAVWSKGAMF